LTSSEILTNLVPVSAPLPAVSVPHLHVREENKMKISIRAKSSSGGEPYIVDFMREKGLLSVFCNCAAGDFGKFCKHKWQLLSGDRSMLYSSEDEEKLQQVEEWVEESSFSLLYSDVNELEAQVAKLKAQIKKAKKDAEKRMREGF